MEPELQLMEFTSATDHDSWLHCYRIALEFGPSVAHTLLETLDKPAPTENLTRN